MPIVPRRLARPLLAGLCIAGLLSTAPSAASERPEAPGELRRRIESIDRQIARVQGQLEDTAASTRGTWLLFKARRALELARIELREVRIWGAAPDELRLALLGPTFEEQGVTNAQDRLRTLSRRRVGSAVRLDELLRTRLANLQRARIELDSLLAQTEASSSWLGGGTPNAGEWADAFLHELGAPVCEENLVLVVAWQAQEGTQARFNPLATTHWMPGATDFNAVGVKNYRSVGQGLAAARETLEDGASSYGYGPILTSLQACDAAEATAWFVNASAWCRGCTGGAYLTGLLPAVRADYAGYAAR